METLLPSALVGLGKKYYRHHNKTHFHKFMATSSARLSAGTFSAFETLCHKAQQINQLQFLRMTLVLETFIAEFIAEGTELHIIEIK